MAAIRYARDLESLLSVDKLFVIGPQAALKRKKTVDALPASIRDAVRALGNDTEPGLHGAAASAWIGAKLPRVVVGVLPDRVSRYNSPARAGAVWKVLGDGGASSQAKSGVVFVIEDDAHLLPNVNALGRAFPELTRRRDAKNGSVSVAVLGADGTLRKIDTRTRETLVSTRLAAELVDMPPTDLVPEVCAGRARKALADIAGVTLREIKGDALLKQGLGGIHGVGRTALSPPRLLIAEYRPTKSARGAPHVALVGKGITYDTGGLHLKQRGGMEGMKSDMGGAAAVLGAFRTLVKTDKPKHRITLLLCIAENAIGPAAYKPDDILTLHSGLTVEINNTDAEGRLLLADGVSYAVRKLKSDVVIDAATLTGAQMIATGHLHGALMSNDDDLERTMIEAGRDSGDLLHPLPFAPELYRKEFDSPIADLRNSVKDRKNAQCSCAGEFVHTQIADCDGVRWAHIDLAGPSFVSDRGTGFGTAVLAESIRRL